MKTLKIAVGFVIIAALAVSCIPEQQSMGDAGSTLVKYTPGDQFGLLAMDALATPQTFTLFEVRRDIPNSTALGKTTTVDLLLDANSAMINAYNAKHKTDFILMPSTLYSTSPAVSGGKVTFTFNAGEFAKDLYITIPKASNFDFSKKYMIAYKITVTGEGTFSENVSDTVYRQVMAKNRFDGKYEVTGTLVDLAVGTITGNYPMAVNLVTTGENQVRFEEPATAPWGSSTIFHSIMSGGAMSVYGSFGLIINFDASNKVVSVVNYYGQPASNTRSAEIDPSGINKWDPAKKVVNIKYFMKQPSSVPAAPNIRTTFDETWTYKGSR
jgi:hypothetical protein